MYPILFEAGPFKIGSLSFPIVVYSYGLMVMLGILTGMIVVHYGLKKARLDPDIAISMGLAATIGGILGARIFYVVGRWSEFSAEPLRILSIQGGGLVWYGGFLGGALACLWILKRNKLPIAVIADISAPAIALGYAVGRLGCFFNGDDYGKPSSLPWAMSFPIGSPPTDIPVHPTQLYETIASLIIFFILLKFRKKVNIPGQLWWIYLIFAGLERFGMEFIRTNEVLITLAGTGRHVTGFTIYHFLSLLLIAASLVILKVRYKMGPSQYLELVKPVKKVNIDPKISVKRLKKKRK